MQGLINVEKETQQSKHPLALRCELKFPCRP
jgi:hypothetical protein